MSFYPSLLAGETLLLLSFVIGIVAHEAGHAVAGAALGLTVRQVTIGNGPVLGRLHWRGSVIVIRAFPMSGFVSLVAQPNMSRRAYAGMLAAGPASNAVLLAAAYALGRWRPAWEEWLMPVVISQTLTLAVTLLPLRTTSWGRPRRSDGLQLWRLARDTMEDPFTLAHGALVGALLPAGTKLQPPSAGAPELFYQILRSDRLHDPVAAAEATAAVRVLLGEPQGTVERVLALDFLAGNGVLFQAGGTPGDLDRWSAEAFRLLPCPATQITRAGVLATSGRGLEAEALLMPLLPTLSNAAWVVVARVHLAQAAAAQGQADTARTWLAEARRLASAQRATRRAFRRLLDQAERAPPLAALPPSLPS